MDSRPGSVSPRRGASRIGVLAALGLLVFALVNVAAVRWVSERGEQASVRSALQSQAAGAATQYATARAILDARLLQAVARLTTSDLGQGTPASEDLSPLVRGSNESLWVLRDGIEIASAGTAERELPVVPDNGMTVARIGGKLWLVTSRPLPDSTLQIAGALALTPGIVGAPLALADSARDVEVVGGIALPLDEVGDQTLFAVLSPPNQNPFYGPLVFLAMANVILVALVLALWRKLSDWRAKTRLDAAVDPLSTAIAAARDGRYEANLRLTPGHPLASLAASFNEMIDAFDERVHTLEHQQKFDALTGLTTRAEARERIARSVDQATIANGTVAAVVMDITRFNEINGTYGHEVGDAVLKTLAGRLARTTRVGDTAARVDGDEFLVLMSDVDEAAAMTMADCLIRTLEAPISINEKQVSFGVRAGVALFPDHCDGPRALRRLANIALMTAKESRKSCVMYAPGQDEQHLRELAIIHDLPAALRDNELYLQYQPKIDVESQRVKTVEALVRWRHPQLGFVPPDEFIGLLERAGQITPLTNWVFEQAVRQCRDWMDAGYDLGVAVNISANDLLDDELPNRVVELLRHYTVKSSRLSIEVTESAVIADPERAIGVLNAFRRAGIKIALDDFGTGQTSLSLLKQLPLSQIKIDKSFVQHLRADSGDAIIVKSIIDLGHNMGLLVTAEGVESNYCWNLLNSYGCDLVQGYLVSAPLTADEMRQWYLRLQKRHVHKLDFEALQNAG